MMLVGKGDGPIIRPQPILEQQPEPVPPAPARVQPQPLLAEQLPTEPRTVSSAERITQVRSETNSATPAAQLPTESRPPLVQAEAQRGSATSAAQASASSTRTEPTSEERRSPPSVADRTPSGDIASGTTATGIPTYVGPRGVVYHYSTSGKNVYERRRR
jgi:hypothetical protein